MYVGRDEGEAHQRVPLCPLSGGKPVFGPLSRAHGFIHTADGCEIRLRDETNPMVETKLRVGIYS